MVFQTHRVVQIITASNPLSFWLSYSPVRSQCHFNIHPTSDVVERLNQRCVRTGSAELPKGVSYNINRNNCLRKNILKVSEDLEKENSRKLTGGIKEGGIKEGGIKEGAKQSE